MLGNVDLHVNQVCCVPYLLLSYFEIVGLNENVLGCKIGASFVLRSLFRTLFVGIDN
jgi:hypothetical protein